MRWGPEYKIVVCEGIDGRILPSLWDVKMDVLVKAKHLVRRVLCRSEQIMRTHPRSLA